ncbi:hypothetical protein GCM10022244_03020 [Streptomyces gulbargensis]|uniref:Uncharacterized protein n=1 Tax=Streptomyces gulbargensis TaxID=364901 RepID=A0ABP7LBE4_9ACTN
MGLLRAGWVFPGMKKAFLADGVSGPGRLSDGGDVSSPPKCGVRAAGGSRTGGVRRNGPPTAFGTGGPVPKDPV